MASTSGRYGYPTLDNTDPMQGPTQITAAAGFWDSLQDETVAAVADLPAASDRPAGHHIWVTAAKADYVTDGSAWAGQNADTGWIDATSLLTASWTSYQPTTWGTVSYRRIGAWVELAGNAQFTAGSNATMFTLPVGFRPAFFKGFVTDRGGAHATINVAADGTVSTTFVTAVGQTFMLSSVHFMLG